MMYQRKTQQGRVLTNMDELVKWLSLGYWVYYRHKPQHPKWILSMKLISIRDAIVKGYISKCLRTDNSEAYKVED